MKTPNPAVETIFNAAKALPPESRAEYLTLACRQDAALHRQVEELLAAADEADGFFEAKPVGLTQLEKTVMDTAAREGPGTRIGRYKLLQQIGEGGMGVVYMAEQEEPVRRRVALKIIKLGMDTQQVIARFEAERQALALMDHPNIARVLDGGTTDSGRPYFVMELVQGVSIIEFCDKAKLPATDRLDLFLQVCAAVQSAHQKGIIHRDLKPSNILVTQHHGKPMPKVIDFGIAKATNQKLTERTLFTQHATMIGTPAYMSPEQAEMSSMDVDTRSDIYSLGVLLYELLTGSTPFPEKRLRSLGYGEMQRVIAEEEPQRPSTRLSTLDHEQKTVVAKNRGEELAELNLRLRGDLDWIVMRCLEKDRTRRYETANGLAADLQRHLNNEPVVARPPSAAYKLQKAWQRNKLAYTAAAAVALALVLGISVSTWQAFKALRAQRETEAARRGEAFQRQEAEQKQREAESERGRADAQARKAVESQEHSRRLLYAAEMNLAQQAVSQNNLGRARRLLDRHRPKPGEEDLRGWEWRYLWQQCRSDALAVLTEKPGKPGMSVSFSPDGTRLAVGFGGDSIEVWDVARRTLLKKLEDAGRDDVHLAFSPRSDLLAVTQKGAILALHDLSTGRDPILWKGTNGIRGISFTSDGQRLTAFTYKLKGSEVVTLDWVQGLALMTNATSGGSRLEGAACQLADGKRLFLSDRNPTTRNWSVRCLDPATDRPHWEAKLGMRDSVTAMALSPDDRFILAGTGSEDAAIHVWEAATGRLVARLQGHSGSISELTFSRDGRRLASASADQTIRLWDTSGEPTRWTERVILRGHRDQVLSVAFSPDGRMLASGGKDGLILLWDPEADRKSPYGYRLLPAEVQDLREISPGVVLVNGTMNPRIVGSSPSARRPFILRLADLSESPVPPGFDLRTLHVDLAPTLFARYEQTNLLRVVELGIGWSELFHEPVGPDLESMFWTDLPAVRGGTRPLTPEQRLLAWATTTGTVHVADLGPSNRRWQWTSSLPSPSLQSFNPDGTLLAIAGTNQWIGNSPNWRKGLEIRSVTTGELLLKSERILGEGSVHFADSGRRLVAVTPTNNEVQVLFWDLARPEQPPRAFNEDAGLFGIYDVTVSPDGRWTSVRKRQGEIVVYDAVAMERSGVVQAAAQQVFSSAFSPDSRRLATGAGGRETVQLWQVETGRELLTLPGTGSILVNLLFVEDGNTLLIGSPARGSWQMWRAPSWEVIQAAEAKDAASSAPGGTERAESRKP